MNDEEMILEYKRETIQEIQQESREQEKEEWIKANINTMQEEHLAINKDRVLDWLSDELDEYIENEWIEYINNGNDE